MNENCDNNEPRNRTKYSYDAASQLAGIVYQGGALTPADLEYTYDLAGRRVAVSGSLASTQLPAAISSAVYNANNQLTQWGSAAMTYDLNGNTLNDGANTYVWDARNRMVSANSNGATFAYDPLGRRMGKTILSANTNFLYDGANPVQELNGTTVTANLLTGGTDERFIRIDSTGTSNFLTDALGSTVALTDTSGNSQVQYSYAPFGSISITGTTNNSYTYTGREIDGFGINYYRARYYNPTIGRFVSEDPAGFAGSGTNFYAYAGDDPMDFNDPFGLDKGTPNPGSCHYADPIMGALEITGKFGPEVELGPVKVGFSMYKNFSTGQTGGKGEVNAGLFSLQADNPTPEGGSFNGGGPGNIEWSGSVLGYLENFTTGESGFEPSKTLTFGAQALLGVEVSYNAEKAYQISVANKACPGALQ